ncbi:MAG: hypothetical protein EA352_09645 [Gemmatimonadales bacterium]|nr:MAG: hypothetical protein EA352_09645 [Gemmatimonadales bacterium]
MIRVLQATALLVVVGIASTPELRGQTITSPYEFVDTRHEAGFFVAHVPGNRGDLRMGPGGGTLTGLRYAFEVTGPFALEVGGFLLPTDRVVRVPQDGGIEDIGSSDALIAALDGRIRFSLPGRRTWHGLAPFLQAGGGLALDFRGGSELEAEIPSSLRFSFGPSFLGVMGAGTRWLPTDNLTVRLDLSTYFWKLGTPDEFLQLGEAELGRFVPQQEWTPVPSFSLGLSYRF